MDKNVIETSIFFTTRLYNSWYKQYTIRSFLEDIQTTIHGEYRELRGGSCIITNIAYHQKSKIYIYIKNKHIEGFWYDLALIKNNHPTIYAMISNMVKKEKNKKILNKKTKYLFYDCE